MKATFRLINSYFWKTIYGPILSFVFPVMLLGILGNIMRIEYVYPGIIALNMLFLGVLALPLAIMELKGSLIFKYIGSSPVNPLKFSIVIILYYIFISILTGVLTLAATIFIFYDKVFPENNGFKYGILGGFTTIAGIGSFSFASFFHLLLVITVGLAIATFSKTPQQALTFAIIIIIPSMFLTGMIVTVDIIAKSQTMQWISRFVPFRYSTGNLVVSTTPLNQLGDIFEKLSIHEKELIFGSGTPSEKSLVTDPESKNYGNIKINLEAIKEEDLEYKKETGIDRDILGKWGWDKETGAGTGKLEPRYLSSSREINDFIIRYQKEAKISYEEIFNLTMKTEGVGGDFFLFRAILINPDALNYSDNNIFKFNQAWSVRKILSTGDIKEFFQNYLSGGKDKPELDITRFNDIIEKIRDGDLRFIDMFIKQSATLYSVPERSLNIFIPLTFITALGIYINKRFTWTTR